MKDTPIHQWLLPYIPEGFKVSIKRDDMTGSVLGGNKIRKLEFLLADAVANNYDSVITCGGIQSNHCRATALAARLVGLNSHLILRTTEPDTDAYNCSGNVLLDRLSAAEMYLVPKESLSEGLGARVRVLMSRLWEEKKERAYEIPLGGSSLLGTFGILDVYQEMMDQGMLENFDDIFVASGSGGTIGGLALANYLNGSPLKVHGVCVCDTADYFYDHIDELIGEYGLQDVKARDICDVIDGYKGEGYGKSTQEELELLIEIAQMTGVVLDPVYTLKATRAMLKEMSENPSRFKGKRVLFIHTGGFFALYGHQTKDLLLTGAKTRNRDLKIWTNATANPLSCFILKEPERRNGAVDWSLIYHQSVNASRIRILGFKKMTRASWPASFPKTGPIPFSLLYTW
ncbi:uncharacterized protein LOC135684731 isoform X2 [Rhopilema esculentum]